MTQLATRPPSAPTVAPIQLSQAADAVLRRWSAGDSTEALPIATIREAAKALPIAQARLEPAAPERWTSWLLPLTAVVRNPPHLDQIRDAASVLAAALATIPASLLTAQRQREACRRFAFWPSAADLAEWLEPEAKAIRAEVMALERMARAPRQPERPVLTPEQREAEAAACLAKAQALRAEVRAETIAARGIARPGRSLEPWQMIAGYRQTVERGGLGAEAAAIRLASLERQFPEAAEYARSIGA
ncbi:hypothetical protein [Rhodovarius lipocyclicus]|uniref:hypothetical protein n=1 Tax=Rhodovarius lipocyclicus TaxID=268410 RepID=UPI00135A3BD1|nr:hypothetical protein [Rhodovarius lipocyclicus]